jgi:hexokinase
MNREIVLAADLGGTNLRMAAIDCQGTILYRTRRETPRGECADEIVEAIVESANECRENCDIGVVKIFLKRNYIIGKYNIISILGSMICLGNKIFRLRKAL